MDDSLTMGLAAVAVLAVLVAWWLRRSGLRWRRRAERAEIALQKSQETLEQHRGPAALGAAVMDVAPHLVPPPAPPAAPDKSAALTALRAALDEHAHRVQAYDDAVQYCLQPVELMPGAEDADLEQLVKFVSDARRRLFAARSDLMRHDEVAKLVAELAVVAPAPTAARPAVPGVAKALAGVATVVRDGGTIADLLPNLLTVAQARNVGGASAFATELAALPPLAAPKWLAPSLLRLLEVTMGLAGGSGEIAVRARPRDGAGIDIEALGQSAEVLAPTAITVYDAEIKAMADRIDEHGAALEVVTGDPRSRGFTLHLPGAPAAIPSHGAGIAPAASSAPAA